MGDLIKASSRFRGQAARTRTYVVKQMDEHDGYLLLKLNKFGDVRTSLMATIPLEVFPNHGLEKGSVIRLECTSRIHVPKTKFAPHIILRSFEIIGGEVCDNLLKQREHRL